MSGTRARYDRHSVTDTTASFTCPRCGAVSHHPLDLAEGYCAKCQDWTGSSVQDLAIEGSCEALGSPEWPYDVYIRYRLLKGRYEAVEVRVTGQAVDGHQAIVNGTVLREVAVERILRQGLAEAGWTRQDEPI